MQVKKIMKKLSKIVLKNWTNSKKEIKKNEVKCFLSGENDDYNIYLEIHAGAGGTESQDWADMLRRMYMKWFDKKNLNMKL